MKTDIDWNKIESEYITTDISYRALAKKYDVSMRTLGDHAKAREWYNKRLLYRDKSVTAVVESNIQNDVNRMARIMNVSDRALTLIEEALEELRSQMLKHKHKVKSVELDSATGKPIKETTVEDEELILADGVIDVQRLNWLTGAIKNIKDAQMLRTDKDEKEQDVRIKKIETDIAKTTGPEDTEGTGLLILPEVKEGEDNDQDDTPEIEI